MLRCARTLVRLLVVTAGLVLAVQSFPTQTWLTAAQPPPPFVPVPASQPPVDTTGTADLGSARTDESYQAPPAPSDTALRPHQLFGFAPYWTLGEEAGFDFHDLTTIAYFGVDVASDGSLVESGSGWDGYQSGALADLVSLAHAAGARVVLTAKNFNGADLHALSSNPAAADRLAGQLATAIGQKAMDGANLDFEGTSGADRQGFSRFVARVSQLLHQANPNWQVSVDTYASSAVDDTGFFDVQALAQSTDALFVMAYDMGDLSTPSPTAPLTGTAWNDTLAIATYLTVVPASKLLLGTPFYGYDWPTDGAGPGASATGPPSVVTYSQVAATGHLDNWDASAGVPWTSYRDRTGQWHEVYYDDPASLALKAQLADRDGLAGLGIWALGMDGNDPAMMAALLGKSAPLKIASGQAGRREGTGSALTTQPPHAPGAPGIPAPGGPSPSASPPTPSSSAPSPAPSSTSGPSSSPSSTPVASGSTSSPNPSPTPTPSPSPGPTSRSSPTPAQATASPTAGSTASSPSPAPTASPNPTPSPIPTAAATPAPQTLKEWYSVYGQGVAVVTATAQALATNIDQADPTRIETSCSALANNYGAYLSSKTPQPPDQKVAEMYDLGRSAILQAESKCADGIISKPNLATARAEAVEGTTLLNSVLDAAQKG